MRRILFLLTGVVLVLGLLHLALSTLAWRHWTAEALWFAGSGLAIFIGGLLNVLMIRADVVDRTQKAIWLFANFALAGFFGLAWLVMKEPQVIVGGLVFVLLCVGVAGLPTARPIQAA